jgi:hypothetical protein
LRRVGGRKPYPWHGTGKNQRYLATTIGRKTYYLHQLVWLYHHGSIPPMLDHINRDPRDCRIEIFESAITPRINTTLQSEGTTHPVSKALCFTLNARESRGRQKS